MYVWLLNTFPLFYKTKAQLDELDYIAETMSQRHTIDIYTI